MRLRYRTVLYQIEGTETLDQYYQQLVDEFVRQARGGSAYTRRNAVWRPPTDIHETSEAYIVRIELAGMAEDEINVTLYANAVVVTGTREDEVEDRVSFHEAQIRYGPFEAVIRLPYPIDREEAEAHYHNGFLRLRLPKKAPDRLRIQSGPAIDARFSAEGQTREAPADQDSAKARSAASRGMSEARPRSPAHAHSHSADLSPGDANHG